MDVTTNSDDHIKISGPSYNKISWIGYNIISGTNYNTSNQVTSNN